MKHSAAAPMAALCPKAAVAESSSPERALQRQKASSPFLSPTFSHSLQTSTDSTTTINNAHTEYTLPVPHYYQTAPALHFNQSQRRNDYQQSQCIPRDPTRPSHHASPPLPEYPPAMSPPAAMKPHSIIFFLVWIFALPSYSLRPLDSDNSSCDPSLLRDPKTLLRDRVTVLINGYSVSRIPLLLSIAAAYSASPTVAAVIVLWGNPSTPSRTLNHLARNLTASSSVAAPISVLRQPSETLNARFLPRSSIATRGVLICDDDVEVDPRSVDFAFRIWSSNPERLVGLVGRSHDLDLQGGTWIYTVHPERYSLVLTKFMIMKTDYLHAYSCGGGARMAEMRRIVDRVRNCEDILMNFVVADETDAAPLLVGAERVRDWGDARNEEVEEGGGRRSRVSGVGLSSRRVEHRKRRGECIREFHRVLGRMPLRYGYGKVVDSVGEQGLCNKGGKLVFCDDEGVVELERR